MGRYLISAVLGAGVTIALALLMQSLIFVDVVPTAEAAPIPEIDFLMPDTVETSRRVPDPRPANELPPMPVIDKTIGTDGPVITISLPGPGDFDPEVIGSGLVMPLTPMVRVMPEYPIRELTRGREGFVIVGFEVDEQGRTQNHTILQSEPPRVFDRAALRSIQQWRYQPQTDDNGNPITVGGQSARLDFVISDDDELAEQ